MEKIEIKWIKYNNFFELWRAHKNDKQMLYVIGDRHHCYIGSIGAHGGLKGLANRYQWQYVDRARAIFGIEEAAGQVSYAGLFNKSEKINSRLILAAEGSIQDRCITVLGLQAVLFKPVKSDATIEIINSGIVPTFLEM